MIKKGIAISKLLKTLKARNVAKKAETVKKAATEKRRVHSKTTRTNFKRARGYSSTQSVKPYNIVAGARDTKIIPVKKMSQKGSTFKTHKFKRLRWYRGKRHGFTWIRLLFSRILEKGHGQIQANSYVRIIKRCV